MTQNLRSTGGFTLIEIVIVLAIIAVLAGILAPTLTRYVGDSRIRKAEVDVQHIGGAIALMYGDTGHWPIWVDGTETKSTSGDYNTLYSADGTMPDVGTTGWTVATNADDFENQIVNNTPGDVAAAAYPTTGRRAWRGPYLEKVLGDPWGSKYLINVEFLQPANVGGVAPVFVLSAGPNKLVETVFDQTSTGPSLTRGGDDVIFRIK